MAKILIAEDIELNQKMLSRRLTRDGHEVVIADNGQEAVNLTQSEHPDIVLMDMSMPVMDGWEATEIIKGNSDTSEVPVIAVTAHTLDHEKTRAKEAGCDDFVGKPINFKELEGIIKEHF